MNNDENSIINDSTHTRSRMRMLYQWLEKTDNLKICPRLTTGMATDIVYAALASGHNKELAYKELIHLGSYNYTGLAGHPDIISAAQDALNKYGTTTCGVRLLNGSLDLHIQFEEKLANFLGTEDAVTFSSGSAANLAVLSVLCSEDDVVFCDEYNHQSILDGLILSHAKVVKFIHSDMEQLEHLLKKFPLNKRKFIISDGVFSMDGDICRLDKISEYAKSYNVHVIIDDAHSIGAIGKNGRGTSSHFDLPPPDVITGSLSKGLPGFGGFVAGSKELINILKYASNPYIFSASLPGPIIAGLLKAIEILESSQEIMDNLHANEKQLRDGIRNIGLDTMNSNSPIIPILIGNREKTFQFAKNLHSRNVYVNPIPFPAVPLTKARLRLNASAALSNKQIDSALSSIEKSARDVGVI